MAYRKLGTTFKYLIQFVLTVFQEGRTQNAHNIVRSAAQSVRITQVNQSQQVTVVQTKSSGDQTIFLYNEFG